MIQTTSIKDLMAHMADNLKPAPQIKDQRFQTIFTGRNKRLSLQGFIAEVIMDSRYNPSVIRWLNEQERIFQIVESELLAEMWGKHKHNSSMSWSKMSRAM